MHIGGAAPLAPSCSTKPFEVLRKSWDPAMLKPPSPILFACSSFKRNYRPTNHGKLELHGSIPATRSLFPRNRVCASPLAIQVPSFQGAIQRLFRADWFRQESGALPGSNTAELHQQWTGRPDWSADLSHAARFDAVRAI